MSAPILLFGMPRSGTTWLGKIFDSHPDTLYRHEPDSYGRLNFIPLAPEPESAPDHAARIRAFVEGLSQVRDTKIAATLPLFPKSYLRGWQLQWNALAARGTKAAARLFGEFPAPLALPSRAAQEARLVWKSIESVARLGILLRALPEARAVLIIRHPCGYLASVRRGQAQKRFSDNESIGEDLGLLEALCGTRIAEPYGLTMAKLRAMPPVERLAWQWALCNEKALTDAPDDDRLLTIRYEDLCRDPIGITRRLFAFTGLDLYRSTERFLTASTSSHHSRYYSVYKDPARAAWSWRHEIPAEMSEQATAVVANTRTGRLFTDLLDAASESGAGTR